MVVVWLTKADAVHVPNLLNVPERTDLSQYPPIGVAVAAVVVPDLHGAPVLAATQIGNHVENQIGIDVTVLPKKTGLLLGDPQESRVLVMTQS